MHLSSGPQPCRNLIRGQLINDESTVLVLEQRKENIPHRIWEREDFASMRWNMVASVSARLLLSCLSCFLS